MANNQDCVRGKFWESRFRAQTLLDIQAVLTCSMYVNLNPIRAGKAETPEESRFTSVYERIAAMKRACRGSVQDGLERSDAAANGTAESTLWICKLELPDRFSNSELAEAGSGLVPNQVNPFPSRRLTNKGYLPMTEEQYLSLLDWTGRQIRSDKRSPLDCRGAASRHGVHAVAADRAFCSLALQHESDSVGRIVSGMFRARVTPTLN